MAFPKPAPPSSTSTSAPLHPRVPYVPGWSVPLPWSVRHQQVLSWVGPPVVQNVSPLPGSPTTPVVPAPPDGQENLPSLQGPARSHPRPGPLPTAGPSGLEVPAALHLQPAPLTLHGSAEHPHPGQSPFSSPVPSTQLHRSSRAVLGAGGSQRWTTVSTARDGLSLLFPRQMPITLSGPDSSTPPPPSPP